MSKWFRDNYMILQSMEVSNELYKIVWYKWENLILNTIANKVINTNKRWNITANKKLNATANKTINVNRR